MNVFEKESLAHSIGEYLWFSAIAHLREAMLCYARRLRHLSRELLP
jgi:hypothetical protein